MSKPTARTTSKKKAKTQQEWRRSPDVWEGAPIPLRGSSMKPTSSRDDNDFFKGPVGSFAEDSPPRRRMTTRPPNYPPHGALPPNYYHHHHQQAYQNMYQQPVYSPHQHQLAHPYGYPPQFAYPPHSVPPPPHPCTEPPPPVETWNAQPGLAMSPQKSPASQNCVLPTPSTAGSPLLRNSPDLSFELMREDSDLDGNFSPVESSLGFERDHHPFMEPVHMQRFTVGAPGGRELASINSMMQRAANHVSAPPPPHFKMPVAQPAKPKARRRPPIKKELGCNCKKTRCLKLYCECLSAKKFCKDCNCTDCYNNEEHKTERDEAIKSILGRNQSAFEVQEGITCRCKRSACLKKYCECFGAGVVCGKRCRCENCANQAGSQLLIDKRRKMKDEVGARYAMEMAASVWGKPVPRMVAQPPMMHSPANPSMYPPHLYYGARPFMPPAPGFSPQMHVNPGRLAIRHQTPVAPAPHLGPRLKRPAQEITPGTPRIRTNKRVLVETRPMIQFWGTNNSSQSKATISNVLSYLPEHDLGIAARVSKQWGSFVDEMGKGS